MQYGWSSPGVPKLLEADSPVRMTEEDAYLVEMLYMAGGIAGLPFTIFVVDKLGRKRSIILASMQNIISWILIAVATNKTILLIARFLTGLNANVAFVSAPMYIAECSDARIRGFLGTFIYILMIVGVLIAYCIVPFMPIWASSTVGAIFVAVQVISFLWMPDSPYWLLMKGRNDQAAKSLRWLRRRDNVEDELAEIAAAVKRQQEERGRPQDLILVPSNRKALLIMFTLNTTQHFCGISVVLMNVQLILQESGSAVGPELSAILFGTCMLIASIAGSPFVDRFGRRALLISSSVLSSLFLGVLGAYFLVKLKLGSEALEDYKVIPLAAVLAYALAYKYGLGLVPIVSMGELFPTSVKAMGMTLADLTYTIMAIISLKVYYVTVDLYGMHFPFLLFCACGILTATFVYFVVPETKGRTLEEIQMILKGGVPSEGGQGGNELPASVAKDAIKMTEIKSPPAMA